VGVPIQVTLDDHDRNRPLLALAVAGAGVAVALAIFGLPARDLHGPLHRSGIMDPFCGGTRALRLAARGDFAASLWWNPLSLVLLVGAVAHLARTAYGLVCQRWLNVSLGWRDRRVWLVVGIAMVALEIRQQAMRDVLMRPGY
jgi:hypothetical protein